MINLIFVHLIMTRFIELETFYKHLPDEVLGKVKSEAGNFNIFKIEDIISPGNKQVNYSRRNFFKVSLITGHNKLHYADKCVEITESALVFTNPMIPYLWERISDQQVGYVCIFTEDFFNRFEHINEYPVFQLTDNAIIPLNAMEVLKYSTIFSRMYDELQGDYIYKYNLLRNLLMEVVHDAQKMQPAIWSLAPGSNASNRIAASFTELLERQFPIELSNQTIKVNSPSAFAERLNIHVNHLNKALKEVTGQTTSQLINDRLLQEAKILLKSTSWSIAEIAWTLGFEEPNHFSSFFKNKVKIPPNKFRQSKVD